MILIIIIFVLIQFAIYWWGFVHMS